MKHPKVFLEIAIPEAQAKQMADRAKTLGLGTDDVYRIAVHEYLDRVGHALPHRAVGLALIGATR
jgi:hypothetical protein